MDAQLALFPETPAPPRSPAVGPADVPGDLREVALELPRELRLGTSSWSFPGWHSLVYDRPASESVLASDGLAAYAAHPMLRAVGLDRTYYRPLSADQFGVYAMAVPDDFRFVVKADRAVTSPLDPDSSGVRRRNAHFLDPGYATEEVVRPLVEGLGSSAGPVLFQFPPMPPSLLGERTAFLERLHRFLEALPRSVRYAVELRTPSLLTEQYVELLEAVGVSHCYNVHPAMSSLAKQLSLVQPFYQPVLLVRWMLRAGLEYEVARSRYEPFGRLVDEDRSTRDLIARTALDALLGEREVFVIASNEAEGSAPLSVFRLGERIARWGSQAPDATSPAERLRQAAGEASVDPMGDER